MNLKPCEYCGCDLPMGVDKNTRRLRSFHFERCEVRLAQKAECDDALAKQQPEPAPDDDKLRTIAAQVLADMEAQGVLLEWQTELRAALAQQPPAPPPEAQTDAEKAAYAFGWYAALEHVRKQQSEQDLIPPGDLFVCGQMGANVTRVRAEQPEPVQQPKPVAWTARELELIDGMIEVQIHHAAQCDSIQNRTMAERQKSWDMERVALLEKIKRNPPREPVRLTEDCITDMWNEHMVWGDPKRGGFADFLSAVRAVEDAVLKANGLGGRDA